MESLTHSTSSDVLPSQVRAARALLGWTVIETAEKVGIGRNTITRIETSKGIAADRTMRDLVAVFEAAGITFLSSPSANGVMIERSPDSD